MAKLIILAFAFTALVAFASATKTIVTTTVEDENPVPMMMCIPLLAGKPFNQCQRYLQQGQQGQRGQSPFDRRGSWGEPQEQGLEQCCNELQNTQQLCQCEAVKQVYQNVKRLQGTQGGQLKQKAENLPNKCNLQISSCQVDSIFTVIKNNRPQQSCSQIQRQRFQQCQSFIQQAQQSSQYGPLLMSVRHQGQQIQQGLQQCCNELERVQPQCQCQALQQVYSQALQQKQRPQPQPWSQQGSQSGGGQTQGLQSIIKIIGNQCDLQFQQCELSSALF